MSQARIIKNNIHRLLEEKGWRIYNSAFVSEEQEQVIKDSLLSTINSLLTPNNFIPSTKTKFSKRPSA